MKQFGLLLAVVALTLPAAGQRSAEFPPDIVVGRYSDVLLAAPRFYRVEFQNDRTRVLRARLPAHAVTPPYDERSGLLLAVTDVHLQFRTSDNHVQEIVAPAGSTRWVDGDTHSAANLGDRTAEFLFVEMKR